MARVAVQHDTRAAEVLGRALVRAARSLDLAQKDVAVMLGISEATTTRIFKGRPIDPKSKEGELAILFLRLHRSLDALLGGDLGNMRRWLHSHNHHVGGRPAEMIRTVTGLFGVVEYLDAMRAKV